MEIGEPKGELTVVVDLGLKPDIDQSSKPDGSTLSHELVHITENERVSRRKALNILARRHGLTPNEVYSAIESAKKSAK